MPRGSWWLLWPWIFIPYFGALTFAVAVLLVVRADLVAKGFAQDRLRILLSVAD